MFYFAGIIIAVFLFALLLLKPNKELSDKILMVWMAVMALHQLLYYIVYSGFVTRYPHLLGLSLPFPVLHGPLLFLYVCAVTRLRPIRRRDFLLHSIPFVILVLAATPFYILSAQEKLEVYHNQGKDFRWYINLMVVLIMASGIGYITWSLFLIRRHRINIEQWFSSTEKKNLQWLKYLSMGLGGIWILVIFFHDQVIFTGVAVLVLFIGFFGINQLPIFYTWQGASLPPPAEPVSSEQETGEQTDEAQSARYAKSGLKEEEARELHEKLTHLMEERALYKNNELTLSELATQLQTHPNYLSQVINEKEQKNFYSYINTWRVKEFVQVAPRAELKHYTLLALAYDCGFNSKSTFNKYFKEFTGKSPSEYFSA